MRTSLPGSLRAAVVVAASAALALTAVNPAQATGPYGSAISPATQVSLDKAYTFLDQRMDVYGSGSTLRLPQSFTGGYLGSLNFVSSFSYDDALVVMAYLERGTDPDIARARTLGDTLLYAQAHDPLGDGRLRASYQPNPFVTADGTPYIGSPATYTGNMAWAGLAFGHLYADTGDVKYLNGALTLADWIQTHTYDTRGPAGYTGGRDANDNPMTYKATEHNIDVAAFFAMLGTLSGDATWTARSQTALGFVASMRDAATGKLWTGTNPDGVSTNYYPVPEDVQTWAYLATGSTQYSTAVDWAATSLAASDGGFTGVSFSNASTAKVWFEGTAHLAAAYYARGGSGDAAKASALLTSLQSAQATAPHADGNGLVAASGDGLDTGYGDTYYASLHTGATAWYILAGEQANPFVLEPDETRYLHH
ncbi:Tat pathway signal sequence domain protein [Kitasatospora sp. NPDC049285]|uniref:Tat pathway signal sequence domain protein n=1 Tax=Kitasatospora sp. NPDC049285 TaxID=3157096 RepID=UPI0034128FE2